MKSSSYSGFRNLTPEKRLQEIAEFSGLTQEDMDVIGRSGSLTVEKADHVIENVVGTFSLPFGVALNFLINGKDYLIPMVLEEPSVVAACSNLAKIARKRGGFSTATTGNIMIAQIQLLHVPAPVASKSIILEHRDDIIRICNEKDPVLVKYGGGVKDVEVRFLDTLVGPMVIVHLLVNVLDAMGANAVNTMAETIAPYLGEWTRGTPELRILSNLADHRLATARATFSKEELGGEDVVDKIISAYAFAAADPYRAATHNKGIMNGIDPVIIATGNDFRAIEAGAHAWAARSGRYTTLTVWEKNIDGDLVGTIELPMAVGLVGGATKVLPGAQAGVKILGVKTASELAQIIAAVGLAQNAAALKALATEGIQKGHMKLHARNVATQAGATGELLDKIVAQMIADKNVHVEYAQELLQKFSEK